MCATQVPHSMPCQAFTWAHAGAVLTFAVASERTACTWTILEISICSACHACACQTADKLCIWRPSCLPIPDETLTRGSVADGHIDDHTLIYPLADAGRLLGLGFLPTIRMSHSDSTREAKWDNRVFVEAWTRKTSRARTGL